MGKKEITEKAVEIAGKLTERQATYLEGYVAGVAAILQHAEPEALQNCSAPAPEQAGA